MLKHAKHFFGFAAALAALLFVVSIFVQPERITDASWIDNRDRNALSVLNEPENSIDVLVLGDSESFTSISPYRLWEKQKITSYVCGQTGQQISEAYYLMKRAFQKQRPDLVILETNELFTHANLVEELRMAVTEDEMSAEEALRTAVILPDEVSWRGFEIRKGCRPCERTDCMEAGEPQPLVFSIRHYLKKIQSFCRKEGSQLLLLSVPSPKNWNAAKHQIVSEYAREEGIDFLDLNPLTQDLKIDWKTDSYDGGDHLNLSGAEKVTDYLGEYLKQRYHFSAPSAGADVRDSWKAGLKEYLEQV